MSRRRRRSAPVGGGGARHPRSLANLKRGGNPPGAGHVPALRHGAYSEALLADVSDEVRELMEALGSTAPVREADGSLPAADVVAFERTARLLRRYRRLEAWLDLHGEFDEKTGDVKPAARFTEEVGASLFRALAELGMTTTSRAKLGLDLARAQRFDLAQHWDDGRDPDAPDTVDGDAEAAA